MRTTMKLSNDLLRRSSAPLVPKDKTSYNHEHNHNKLSRISNDYDRDGHHTTTTRISPSWNDRNDHDNGGAFALTESIVSATKHARVHDDLLPRKRNQNRSRRSSSYYRGAVLSRRYLTTSLVMVTTVNLLLCLIFADVAKALTVLDEENKPTNHHSSASGSSSSMIIVQNIEQEEIKPDRFLFSSTLQGHNEKEGDKNGESMSLETKQKMTTLEKTETLPSMMLSLFPSLSPLPQSTEMLPSSSKSAHEDNAYSLLSQSTFHHAPSTETLQKVPESVSSLPLMHSLSKRHTRDAQQSTAPDNEESKIKSQEPFTVLSLKPEPLIEAAEEIKDSIKNVLLEELEKIYKETGIDTHIDYAIENVEPVANSLLASFRGLYEALAEAGDIAESFFSFGENLVRKQAGKLLQNFENICSDKDDPDQSSSEHFDLANGFQEVIDEVIGEGSELIQDLKNLFVSLGDKVGGKIDIEGQQNSSNRDLPLLHLKERGHSASNAQETKADYGALCLTLSGSPIGIEFYNKKTGLYFETNLGLALDFGFLLASGDFKGTAALGMGVELGRVVDRPNCSASASSGNKNQRSLLSRSGDYFSFKQNFDDFPGRFVLTNLETGENICPLPNDCFNQQDYTNDPQNTRPQDLSKCIVDDKTKDEHVEALGIVAGHENKIIFSMTNPGFETGKKSNYKFLTFVKGLVTIAEVGNGQTIVTGQFSGCKCVLYNDINGNEFMAHLGTCSDFPYKTKLAKCAWNHLVDSGGAVNIRMFDPLDYYTNQVRLPLKRFVVVEDRKIYVMGGNLIDKDGKYVQVDDMVDITNSIPKAIDPLDSKFTDVTHCTNEPYRKLFTRNLPTEPEVKSSAKENGKKNQYPHHYKIPNTQKERRLPLKTESKGSLGMTFYLPGHSEEMNGFNRWDVGLSFGNIPFFEGIVFHISVPWYACRDCDGSYRLKTIKELLSGNFQLSGFTINFLSYTKTWYDSGEKKTNVKDRQSQCKESFKTSLGDFFQQGGVRGAIQRFISQFGEILNNNFNPFTNDISISFSPVLSVGLFSTENDWDIKKNFNSAPFVDLSSNQCKDSCGRRFTKEEEQQDTSSLAMSKSSNHNDFEVQLDNYFVPVDNNMPKALIDASHTRRLLDPGSFTDAISVFSEVMSDGGFSMPYCFGNCAINDESKSLSGSIAITPSEDCDALSLVAAADEITLGNVIYLILKEEIPIGFFAEFGLDNVEIELELDLYPSIELSVEGSPHLPDLRNNTSSVEKFFYDILDGLTFIVTGELRSLEYFSVSLEAAMSAVEVSSSFALKDEDGLGPSVEFQFEINGLKASSNSNKVTTFRLKIPMTICVSACSSSNREIIILKGDVYTQLVIGTSSPPASSIGGTLELKGEWEEPFGIKILQLSNLIAGASFGLSPPTFPQPVSLLLGADICLGSKEACDAQDASKKNFIRAIVYIGLNVNIPQDNYLLAMISSFTLEHILNVMAVMEPDIATLTDVLPKPILETGITPYDENSAGCVDGSGKNTTALILEEEEININCYAYIAISPFKKNTIEPINLVIDRGISFGGKLNFFDLIEIRVEAKIDVIETKNPSFYLSSELKGLKLGKALQFGNTCDTNGCEGDAIFLIDYATVPFKLLVEIEGAVAMPIIKTYAAVAININNEGASFSSDMVFLGVMTNHISLEWAWDFSYFKGRFGDVVFIPYILEIKELSLEIRPAEKFEFKMKITILTFLGLEAGFDVERRGTDVFVSFLLVVDLLLMSISVSGSAIVDTKEISNTDFESFSIAIGPGKLMELVLDFLKDAIKFVAAALEEVLHAVDTAIQVIGDTIKTVVDTVGNFIDKAIPGLGESLAAFASNAVDAATALWDSAVGIFTASSWEDVGNAILDGLEAIGNFIVSLFHQERVVSKREESTKCDDVNSNRFDCDCLITITRVKKCWGFLFIFKCGNPFDRYSKIYSDIDCIEERMRIYEKVKGDMHTASVYAEGSDKTMKGNKGLMTADIDNLSEPEIETITGEVPYPKNDSQRTKANPSSRFTTSIKGRTQILDNHTPNGLSNQKNDFESSNFDIVFNPLQFGTRSESEERTKEMEESLRAGFSGVPGQVKDLMMKDQEGLDDKINQFGSDEPIPLKISIPPNRKVLTVSCSNMEQTLSSQKPVVDQFDETCGDVRRLLSYQEQPGLTKQRVMSMDPSNVPSNFYCGTIKIIRKYTSRDFCDQSSDAEQIFYLLPEGPMFTFVPEFHPEYPISTSVETIDPDGLSNSWPDVVGGCNDIYPAELDASDSYPTAVADSCGLWSIARIWSAYLNFGEKITEDCKAAGHPMFPPVQTTQTFYMKDDEAPRFIKVGLKELHIPFFDNFNSTESNAPLIQDIPSNYEAREWGLAVGEESLSSMDSDYRVMPSDFAHEATCRQDGIAQFTRTWTATDACGNFRMYEQRIIIDHPPESLTETGTLQYGIHSYVPGVEQLKDACIPGKHFKMGYKSFHADFNFEDKVHVCNPGNAEDWDENGCRLEVNDVSQSFDIWSVKPEFESFPKDTTILTDESMDPENTGIPIGRSYCSTPFQIKHEDEPAELVSCGVWTIQRRWSIRPLYYGCEEVSFQEFVTEKVQIITVKDVFAPDFFELPQAIVDIPFVENYGPARTGVPEVRDVIYHPSLIEHAMKYNANNTYLFVSYPTTLTYDDSVNFSKTPKETVASNALAVVERTWTTMDRCGYSNSWLQIVNIVKPSKKIFGDASGYQLASLGDSVDVDESEIAQDIISFGKDFRLDRYSNISCSTGYWKGCTTDANSHPSLIFKTCPENRIYSGSLLNGTVLYGIPEIDPHPKSKKKKRKNVKETSTEIVDVPYTSINLKDTMKRRKKKRGKKCSVFKKSKKMNDRKALSMLIPELPVNFHTIKEVLASKSKEFDRNLNELLTGPLTVNCTEPFNTSCFTVEESNINKIHATSIRTESIGDNNLTLTLVGKHQVYNIFSVDIQDWFYPIDVSEAPQTLNIEAEGYIFVSVLDTIKITPISNYTASVKRSWDSAMDFECTTKYKKKKELRKKLHQKLPVLSNHKKRGKGEKSISKSCKSPGRKNKCKNYPKGRNMRDIVLGEFAQDASTHLFVNHVTVIEYGEYNKEQIPDFDKVMASYCSGIQYEFSAKDYNNKIMQATHLFTNPTSSLEMEEYIWTGGQLIFSGTKLYLNKVGIKHGLHLADESYFILPDATS